MLCSFTNTPGSFCTMIKISINPLVTNGFSHPYHLDVSISKTEIRHLSQPFIVQVSLGSVAGVAHFITLHEQTQNSAGKDNIIYFFLASLFRFNIIIAIG